MIMAFAGLTLCVSTIMAQKNSRRIARNVPDTVVITKTDTVFVTAPAANQLPEGKNADIAYITNSYQLEAYKQKLAFEKEEARQKAAERMAQRDMDREYDRQRNAFNMISKYSSLVAIWLVPLAVIFLYVYHQRRRREQVEMVFDMLRSGIEVSPEILAALGIGSGTVWQQMANGMNAMMNGAGITDISTASYCLKRVVWGILIIVVSFFLACIFNNGAVFYIGAVIASVMFAQAFIRHRLQRTFIQGQRKNSAVKDMTGGNPDADV